MHISYRWLTSLLGREIPLNELEDRLIMAGLEVESVNDLGVGHGRILVARVLTRDPHPNADNLSICSVDAGRAEPLRIVCGAKNFQPGDLVPLAVEGAVLPGDFVIKKSKIRGEASEGMMCSGRELGMGDDHDGLLLLPQDGVYKHGQPFDAILEIKVTPNRPDCLSVLGVARDLAAQMGLEKPQLPGRALAENGAPAASQFTVANEAEIACPRYLGRVIRGVTIAPSPLWLRRAVESFGSRSINNVVDVTNYIMIEMGQPLHAFDAAALSGGGVRVRHAAAGETLELLDGKTATLAATDLVIADGTRALALAGIMGGKNSEITSTTTDVFLECALFESTGIRRTAKRLGLATDSSYRFERGVDGDALQAAVDRAAALIAEVAGGTVAAGTLAAGPGAAPRATITLRPARVNALLGLDVPTERMVRALTTLGFIVEGDAAGDALQVRIPGFRPDVHGEADLSEEIARIEGYDTIPSVLPRLATQPRALAPEQRALAAMRNVFVGAGLCEVMNYSFTSESLVTATAVDAAQCLALQNPLTAEYSLMRPSLLPPLLATAQYNAARGVQDLLMFESGHAFRPSADGPPTEFMQVAVLLSGQIRPATWHGGAGQSADFFVAKALAEQSLAVAGVSGVTAPGISDATPQDLEACGLWAHDAARLWHPGKAAVLKVEQRAVAVVGELHPSVAEAFDFRRPVVLIVMSVPALLAAQVPAAAGVPPGEFPGVRRDLALVADAALPAATIEAAIAKRAKSLLAGLTLFDIYTGDKIPAGKRSLAYALRLEARDRTLTDEEVGGLMTKILADLEKLGVELRS